MSTVAAQPNVEQDVAQMPIPAGVQCGTGGYLDARCLDASSMKPSTWQQPMNTWGNGMQTWMPGWTQPMQDQYTNSNATPYHPKTYAKQPPSSIYMTRQQHMQPMQHSLPVEVSCPTDAIGLATVAADDEVMAIPSTVCAFGNVRQEVELARCCEPEAPCQASDVGLLPAQSLSDQGKLVVVLDLDETLVRFRQGPVYWRPHFNRFLDAIKDCCEVVLWTASTEECAARVMNELDPHGDRLHHKVFRTDRWFHGVPYTKDLTLLNRDMQRVVIIENTIECVTSNTGNAILVPDYITPNQYDTALLVVMDLCMEMAKDTSLNVTKCIAQSPELTGFYHEKGTIYCVSMNAQRKHFNLVFGVPEENDTEQQAGSTADQTNTVPPSNPMPSPNLPTVNAPEGGCPLGYDEETRLEF